MFGADNYSILFSMGCVFARNNGGFGLITVVIGIASVSVLALIIAGLSQSMFRYGANVNALSNSRGVVNILTGVIAYPNLCKASLQPSTLTYIPTEADSDDGMKLAFLGGNVLGVLSDGTTLPAYGLRINLLRFRTLGPPSPDTATPGNQLYSGSLFITMTKVGDPNGYLGGSDMKKKIIGTMVLSVNPSTNAITSCYAISGAKQACTDMGGTYTPGGSPQCKLPYPCGSGSGKVFMGYQTDGSPNCYTAAQLIGQTCPANTYLVSNGDGTARCQSL